MKKLSLIGVSIIPKNVIRKKQKCKHCEFLESIFGTIPGEKKSTKRIFTEREYWLYTEVFVYLHGNDECNLKKLNYEKIN